MSCIIYVIKYILGNNPSVYCENVLLSLIIKLIDWPVDRKHIGGRENTRKKRGRVKGIASQTQRGNRRKHHMSEFRLM